MKKWFTVSLATIFLFEFAIFASTQFTLWPEMVLYPWLQNNGFLLYRDIINPYFPLFNWILSAATTIFGYDLKVFIGFTWSYIFITQLFFLYLVQKLFKNKRITFFSLLIFAIHLIIFEGNGLWFDLVVMFPLLLAFYSLLNKKYLFAGIFLGIGFLIKQTIAWAIMGSILYIFVGTDFYVCSKTEADRDRVLFLRKKPNNTLIFIIPIVLFLVIISTLFYFQGTLPDFYFWAVELPFGQLQKTPGFVELPTKRNILIMLIAFWPIIIFFPKIIKDKILSLSFTFFVSTFVFAFPRFGYFHLVACIPFFSIIAAKIFSTKKIIRGIYLFLLGILLIFVVKKEIPFSIRFFDKDTYPLTNKINSLTAGERFFLQNSPQQIYFINNVLPPKPWVANFPWYFENSNLQKRMIKGIKNTKINWIIQENYQKNKNIFAPGTYRPQILQDYFDKNYFFKKKINNNIDLFIKNEK